MPEPDRLSSRYKQSNPVHRRTASSRCLLSANSISHPSGSHSSRRSGRVRCGCEESKKGVMPASSLRILAAPRSGRGLAPRLCWSLPHFEHSTCIWQVAPPELLSLSMGFWFLSSAGGNFVAGWLGSLYCVLQSWLLLCCHAGAMVCRCTSEMPVLCWEGRFFAPHSERIHISSSF